MFSVYPGVVEGKVMTHHKCFTNIISFNPQNNHKKSLILFPIRQGGKCQVKQSAKAHTEQPQV